MKNNSIIKLIIFTLVGIVGLALVREILFPAGYGFGIRVRGNMMGGEHMYMNGGIGIGGTVSLVLLFLIKILFVVFIISLVAGIVVYVKNNLFTAEDMASIKGTFSANKFSTKKVTRNTCGKELNTEWKVCPHCGAEKEIQNI